MKPKYRIKDLVVLKNSGLYNNCTAKILEVYKDTYKVSIGGVSYGMIKLISEDQILKKL